MKRASLRLPALTGWAAVGVAATLAGCATPPGQSGATFDLVQQELSRAAAANAKSMAADKVAEAMLPPLQLPSPKAAESESRFDLVVSGAPAAQVFMAVVAGTRYSMLFGPELSGTISLNLKNVTLFEALDSIRELYGYDYRVTGTRIFLLPNTMQTRVFQVNYLAGRRQGQSDLRVTSSSITTSSGGSSTSSTAGASTGSTGTAAAPSSSSATDSSRVRMSSDVDFWSELRAALVAVVGTEGGRSVILNAMSGVVVVKGMPADIRNVEQYLKATQLIVERQVMLEAKVLEVTLNEDFQSGVNWAAFGRTDSRYAAGAVGKGVALDTAAGSPLVSRDVGILPGAGGALATAAAGSGFFGLAFQTANFAALLNFLETQGSVQVLSSPRIATLNNQKAVLKVGSDEFYVTNVSSSTSTTGSTTTNTPSITLQPFFSGIALDVTPQIDDGINITLHVHPSISVVSEKQKNIDLGSLGQFNLPLATSSINETDSIVRVQNGHVVAIGGLMKQEQASDRSQLPGAGDGVASSLFGQRTRSLKKRELVILIKPTLIQNEQSWNQDLVDTQARLRDLDPRRVITVPAQ